MKMIKTAILSKHAKIAALLFAAGLALFSFSNFSDDANFYKPASAGYGADIGGTASVSFKAGSLDGSAKTIKPGAADGYLDALTDIHVYGTPSGGERQELASPANRAALEALTLELEPAGAWAFEMTAKLDGVAFAASTTKVIAAGRPNSVLFDLKAGVNYGGLSVTVNFAGSAPSKVLATLCKQNKTEQVEQKEFTDFGAGGAPTFTYGRALGETTGLAAGTYYLKFDFYKNGLSEPVNSFGNYVRIVNGLTSRAEFNIDLNAIYSITYKYYLDGVEMTESQKDAIIASLPAGASLPEYYSRKSEITLPELSHEDWDFEGWFTSESSPTGISVIGKGMTGPATVYARFYSGSGDPTAFLSTLLTLEAAVDNVTVTFAKYGSESICFMKNNNSSAIGFVSSPGTETILLEHAGDKVSFWTEFTSVTYYDPTTGNHSNITCDKDCYVYGNITTLLNTSQNFSTLTEITQENAFRGLFAGTETAPNKIKNKANAPLLLPATTLAKHCYDSMFAYTTLTKAPELKAPVLAEGCYTRMFYGCENLSKVTCLATNISAANCVDDWLDGVASSGTFTKATDMTAWTSGASGIPSGWTVREAEPVSGGGSGGGTSGNVTLYVKADGDDTNGDGSRDNPFQSIMGAASYIGDQADYSDPNNVPDSETDYIIKVIGELAGEQSLSWWEHDPITIKEAKSITIEGATDVDINGIPQDGFTGIGEDDTGKCSLEIHSDGINVTLKNIKISGYKTGLCVGDAYIDPDNTDDVFTKVANVILDSGVLITGVQCNHTDSKIGGGVTVKPLSKLYMKSGAKIISNESYSSGGAVNINDGAYFYMQGGEISGNTLQVGAGGSGVYVGPSSYFAMSGDAKVASDNDVYLDEKDANYAKITIASTLTAESPVATITPYRNNSPSYDLTKAYLAVTSDSGTTPAAEHSKFAVTPINKMVQVGGALQMVEVNYIVNESGMLEEVSSGGGGTSGIVVTSNAGGSGMASILSGSAAVTIELRNNDEAIDFTKLKIKINTTVYEADALRTNGWRVAGELDSENYYKFSIDSSLTSSGTVIEIYYDEAVIETLNVMRNGNAG